MQDIYVTDEELEAFKQSMKSEVDDIKTEQDPEEEEPDVVFDIPPTETNPKKLSNKKNEDNLNWQPQRKSHDKFNIFTIAKADKSDKNRHKLKEIPKALIIDTGSLESLEEEDDLSD